jgi:hypothetical protein
MVVTNLWSLRLALEQLAVLAVVADPKLPQAGTDSNTRNQEWRNGS